MALIKCDAGLATWYELLARLAERLPASSAPQPIPCIWVWSEPHPTCDLTDYSLWQCPVTGRIWVRCTGGIAGIDVWRGPGEPTLLVQSVDAFSNLAASSRDDS